MDNIQDDGFEPCKRPNGAEILTLTEGDSFTGIYKGKHKITAKDGSTFDKNCFLSVKDNKEYLLPNHRQINDAIELYPGEVLRIVYNGKVRIKGGKTVADYTIGHKPA